MKGNVDMCMSPTRRTSLIRRTARKAQRGLTLLEIMIVIAILGLLVVIVVPRVMGAFGKSKTDLAKIQVDKWKGQWQTWSIATKSDKTCSEIKLLEDVGKFSDKETTADDLMDPWSHQIGIMCDDSGVKGIYSWGENGKDEKGEGDDIASWKKPKQ